MGVRRILPEEAKALVEDGWVYLDVRSVPEFEAGHPPGAVNVPILHRGPLGMMPNADFLRVLHARFPVSTGLVVSCASGVRSQQAARFLVDSGFENVVEMRGGFLGERDAFGRVVVPGWMTSGYEVTTDSEDGEGWEALIASLDGE